MTSRLLARTLLAKFKQERVSDCSEERVARSSPGLRGWADAIVEDWNNLNCHCLDCGEEHCLCEVEGEGSIPESSILGECMCVATVWPRLHLQALPERRGRSSNPLIRSVDSHVGLSGRQRYTQ